MTQPVWKEIDGPMMPCGHRTTRIVGTNDMGEPIDFVQDMDHPDTGEKCCRECYVDAMERRPKWSARQIAQAFGAGSLA